MPVGTFIPFDEADYTPRFFARPVAFQMECPHCGRLLIIGRGGRDTEAFNRITSVLICPQNSDKGAPGCGHSFLIGMVAWPMTHSPIKKRPHDQRPNSDQLAELRELARGVHPKRRKTRGDPVNQIEPEVEVPDDDT